MNILRIAAVCAFAAASTSVSESDVCACAPAMRAGDTVHISEESALIVWDAQTKTQHFIRRAQFDTKAKDFGFLVPSPTRPALSEVDDAIFDHLVNLTRPPVREVARVVGEEVAKSAATKAASAAPVVTVLETVTVAGLDAAVLSANDAKALNDWLRGNGYASSPDLVEWFKPYIAAKWILTAFKISKGASQADRTVTSAVRMSFRTELPFFPYREPATRNSAPRALEVYFVAGERVDGRIGAAAQSWRERFADMVGLSGGVTGKWPGQTLWAKPLDANVRDDLLKRVKLPANAVPAQAWLTRFLDSSAPRPGADEVYFSRAGDQSPYADAARLEAELERKETARRAMASAGDKKMGAAERLLEREQIAAERHASGRVALSMLNEGKTAEASGNVLTATRLYRQAVLQGSGEAAKMLGDIYATGKGDVPKDYGESLRYYALAEKHGINIDRGKRP